jgi:hypothetical protein
MTLKSKDRQYNGQKNNNLQNTNKKTNGWTTRTSLKLGDLSAPKG